MRYLRIYETRKTKGRVMKGMHGGKYRDRKELSYNMEIWKAA